MRSITLEKQEAGGISYPTWYIRKLTQGEERRKEVAKWIRSRTNSREFPGGPVIRALHFSLPRARFNQKLHGMAKKKKKISNLQSHGYQLLSFHKQKSTIWHCLNNILLGKLI